MSEVLRRLGCDVTYERTPGSGGGGRVVVDVPEKPGDRDRLRPGAPDARLDQRARPAGGPLRHARGWRCPAATRSAPAAWTCTSPGWSGWARRSSSEHGFLVATAPAAAPARRSGWTSRRVGATENLVMAAVLAEGTTVIDNAAREPEIVDLCAMLAAMGARIDGAGTSTITVEGVDSLSPGRRYTTVPDRIVAGTWAFGAVMTRGDVVIERAVAEHLAVAAGQADRRRGARWRSLPDGFRVAMDGPAALRRRRHAALPGLPHRPAAHGGRAGRGLDRHGPDHRERLRGPVHVRQRAGAARRRRPHRRPPRRRPRPGAALRRPGGGHRHPRRRRAWCSPGWCPTASPRCRTCTTSTAAIPTSWSSCAASAREIERTRAPRLSQLAGEGRGQRAGAVGVLGEDQDVGPVRGRDADRRADAGVGEHRSQRQRGLPAGQRGDQGEQAVVRGRPAGRVGCRP